MDDEEEMRMLRQSSRFQQQKLGYNAINKGQNELVDDQDEDENDIEQDFDQPTPQQQSSKPKNSHIKSREEYEQEKREKKAKKHKKSKKSKKKRKKRDEKSKFKLEGESSDSSSEDAFENLNKSKITDTELVKKQRYLNINQGLMFNENDNLEETSIKLSTEQRKSMLKSKLLHPNKDEFGNKHKRAEDIIPDDFGKIETKMGQKEKFRLFSKVKKQKVAEFKEPQIIQRNTIDIEEDEDDLIGPPIPKEILMNQNDNKPESDENVKQKVNNQPENDQNEEHKINSNQDQIPSENFGQSYGDNIEEDDDKLLINAITSHESVLSGHSRPVSALSIDPSGNRLATGSYDETVRLWDFLGMNRSMMSFKEFTPYEGYPI